MLYVMLGCASVFMKVLRSVTSTYTPELYSTSSRTTALGLMSSADRFASILQPMIFSALVYSSFKLAMIGYGACYLLALIVSLTLRTETSNLPLKESFLMSMASDLDTGRSAMDTSMFTDSVVH